MEIDVFYLVFVFKRGWENKIVYMRYVVEKIVELWGIIVEEVVEVIY